MFRLRAAHFTEVGSLSEVPIDPATPHVRSLVDIDLLNRIVSPLLCCSRGNANTTTLALVPMALWFEPPEVATACGVMSPISTPRGGLLHHQHLVRTCHDAHHLPPKAGNNNPEATPPIQDGRHPRSKMAAIPHPRWPPCEATCRDANPD